MSTIKSKEITRKTIEDRLSVLEMKLEKMTKVYENEEKSISKKKILWISIERLQAKVSLLESILR